ncbi:MAG: hypothetical protein WBM07_08650 [Chitinivibrionales bacterium]
MKKVSFFQVLAVALIAAFFFGCAKAPQQEISAAKASVEAAKAMKADVFAPEQYATATGYLDAAMAEVNTQNAKSPISRKYEKSIKLLKETVAAADAAKNAVSANKAKMIADVNAQLAAAQASAADAKKAIEAVSKKNKDAADLGAKLDAAVVTLPKEITEDNIMASQETVKSVAAQIGSIKAAFDQLQAAKPAKKGKGKKK